MQSATSSSPQHPLALITGASVGLGREFARRFAADGFNVALVARHQEQLQNVKSEIEAAHGVTGYVLPGDLSDPECPGRIHRAVRAEGLDVTVLVNNAGFGGYGFFHETDLEPELRMIQVNVASLVALTKLFVRDMVARGSGHIINVSSTAAFQPGPLQSVYYATKSFVLSFSEAIDNELSGTGVRVTAFCPGPTRTEFHKRAGTEMSFGGMRQMTAEDAVRAGYEGYKKGKRVVIAGAQNRFLAFSTRLAPRRLTTHIARRLQETSNEKS